MPLSLATNTCWLYLVRHGATANNLARPPRLQGRRTNPALSGEGHQQARATAALLAGGQVDTVYCSPLLRARQTAQAIAEPHGLTVEVIDDLIEVDVGDWEGRRWDDVQRINPEAYRLFKADAGVNPYLGGECLGTVQARVAPAIGQLLADNPGRVVVAVAHNCVNRSYLAHLLDMPLAQYRRIPQDNCGLNLIRYRDDRAKLVTVNAVGHLHGRVG